MLGGAARAACRLYRALVDRGLDVSYLVHVKQSSEVDAVALGDTQRYERWLDSMVQQYYINENRTDLSNTWFSYIPVEPWIDDTSLCDDADIINLHWVEQFVSLRSLQRIVATGKPIVWTLHDMRPFTGGCHYSAGCTQYRDECLHCPQLEKDPYSLAAVQLQSMKKVLQGAHLTVVSPSRWLAEEAAKSSLFRDRRIEVIPNSLETNVYVPREKQEAKKDLGISAETVTVMFGAVDSAEQRKGFHVLVSALAACRQNAWFAEQCREKKLLVIVVGHCDEVLTDLPLPIRQLGYLETDREMAVAYSATDLFILPSLEDNLPNTVLESMACGTPVLAFDTGGIPDLVQHGENGYLVERGNAAALAAALLELLRDDKKRQLLAGNCRSFVEQGYSGDTQGKRYEQLFREIMTSTLSPIHKSKEQSAELSFAQQGDLDAITGCAIRRYFCQLEEDEMFPDGLAGMLDVDYGRLVHLEREVAAICNISLLRRPVSKYRAYQKILRAFRDRPA